MNKPKTNGNMIEQYVINLLEYNGYSVNFIDGEHDIEISDWRGNKIIGEIKSCQQKIIDINSNAGYRNGRFNIPQEQHEHMKAVDGHYIFVVHDLHIVHCFQIVRAINLTIANRIHNIRWVHIYEEYRSSSIELSKFQTLLTIEA